MPISDHLNFLTVAAILTGGLSLFYLVSLTIKIRKVKLISSLRKLFGLLFFSMASGFFSLILLSTQGYRALTLETKVADIKVFAKGAQQFSATIVYNDGTRQAFDLVGDEIMIEANILKWKPWSNIMGLKTAYRLDRIRGRFSSIEDEQAHQPTLFPIQSSKYRDIADWRKEYYYLSYLVDVEHGSASYVSAAENRNLELMVTTNGLMLRAK